MLTTPTHVLPLLDRLVESGWTVTVAMKFSSLGHTLTLTAACPWRDTHHVKADSAGDEALEWAMLELAFACDAAPE
jgi:hypothetical protein